jgi:hypothetical protein
MLRRLPFRSRRPIFLFSKTPLPLADCRRASFAADLLHLITSQRLIAAVMDDGRD